MTPNGPGVRPRTPSENWVTRNWTTIVRVTGWAGVVFSTLVWLLSHRLSPELLALFGTLMGVGEGLDAIRQLTLARSRTEEDQP